VSLLLPGAPYTEPVPLHPPPPCPLCTSPPLQEAERSLCAHLNTLAMRLVAKAEAAAPSAGAGSSGSGKKARRQELAEEEQEEEMEAAVEAASPRPSKRARLSKGKGGVEGAGAEELLARALVLLEQSFRVAEKGIAGGVGKRTGLARGFACCRHHLPVCLWVALPWKCAATNYVCAPAQPQPVCVTAVCLAWVCAYLAWPRLPTTHILELAEQLSPTACSHGCEPGAAGQHARHCSGQHQHGACVEAAADQHGSTAGEAVCGGGQGGGGT
jgi:hypothetical protein